MRVAKNVKMSLSDATKPLLVLSRLVGMNPQSHWHKIYSICILVYEFSILIWLWQYHIERKFKNDYFFMFVHSFEDTCRMISVLIILGSGLVDRKRFMIPVTAIENVDANLESLGSCSDNRETYRSQGLLIIYAVLMPSFFWLESFIIHTLLLEEDQVFKIILMSGFYNLTVLLTNAVLDCSFSSTLSIIRRRFKEINLIIRCDENHGSYIMVDSVELRRARTNDDVKKQLKMLRREYHNLWGIANKVNVDYGLHLLVGITTSFALITSKLWESYYASLSLDKSILWLIVGGISWVVFYITRMLFLVYASESTVAEAKATSVVLQELAMKGNHDGATKDEIRDFLMQLQLEAQNFTACGFLDIDFKLISRTLGAICTYLVILIQMSDSNCGCITGHANKSIQMSDKDL